MLKSLPHTFLFSLTLALRTFLLISSSNPLAIWAALETNLLSFLPLILTPHKKKTTEAGIVYFLAQATGSSLVIVSLVSYSYTASLPTGSDTAALALFVGIAIKIGAAPTHF